ncbi:MAG: hypothetical protein ACPG7F_04605, partial [Aggregatilineales bacterium]
PILVLRYRDKEFGVGLVSVDALASRASRDADEPWTRRKTAMVFARCGVLSFLRFVFCMNYTSIMWMIC